MKGYNRFFWSGLFFIVAALLLVVAIIRSDAHAIETSNVTMIEAEDYDQGGEGVAYHDTTAANHGNADYRKDEAVDLWNVTEDIIKVGSVATGEWLHYTHDFLLSGEYEFTFYLATPNDNATMKFYIDGVEQTEIKSANTGGYRDFQEFKHTVKGIEAGEHVIKLEFTAESLDIDKFFIEHIDPYSKLDAVTYTATTDKKFSCSWDVQDAADFYEVQIYNLERKTLIQLGENGATFARVDEPPFEIQFPWAGHFVPQIRACLIPEVAEGEDPKPKECSTWSQSIDPEVATVDGEKKGWWLYGYTAPPGPIVTEQP